MKARAGQPVQLYFDGLADLQPGDALVTPTLRAYLITDVRVVRRGPNAGRRRYLTAVVFEHTRDLPPDTVMHPMRWYSR